MKKRMTLICCCLLTLLSASAHTSSLTIGWHPWSPYQNLNNKNKLTGLDVDIIKAISKEVGIEFQYNEIPWKRHLQLIRSGEIDMAAGASNNESRKNYAYFSIPYRHEYVMLFVKKDKLTTVTLNKLSDLINSKYMIGAENGYYYGEEFADLVKQVEFQAHINYSSSTEENIILLNQGFIDGMLADPMTMKSLISTLKLEDKIEAHPLFISRATIHIMLSKKSTTPAMLDKINNAITTLKSNGEILQMIKHWTGDKTIVK